MDQRRVRRFAIIFAFLLSFSVQAETVGLQFKGAKLGDVIEGVVKGILGRDYILAGDLPSLQSPVTLNVKSVDRLKVFDVLRSVASSFQVSLVDRDGIIYVEHLNGRASVADSGPVESVSHIGPSASVSAALIPFEGSATRELEPRAYFPKFRTVEFLSMAVQAAGGRVAQSGLGQMVSVGQPGQGGGGSAQSQLKRDVLVYSGSPELLAKIDRLLDQLDVPMMAVQLKAAVFEVSDTSEHVRSLSAVLTLLGGRVGLNLGAGVKASGNAVTLSGTNLQAVLSAVDGDSRFRYLSEPSLRVLDGESARLVVGQDVPVRGAVTVDKNGNSLQSIEYQTAGLVLEVAPRVLQNSIQLRINQQISSFTTTTTSGIDSPTKLRREASTTIQAEDGELIALAGLDENRENATNSGLSFLPSWFNSKSADKSRSQVLILLEVKKVPGVSI